MTSPDSKTRYDIATTIVTGIVCKKCKNELPPMTMKQHLESDFNTECPHTAKPKMTSTQIYEAINTKTDPAEYNETEKYLARRGFVELVRGRWVKGKLLRIVHR